LKVDEKIMQKSSQITKIIRILTEV
jgi:CspA family cold shock protein